MWQFDLKISFTNFSDKTLAMLSKHIHHELLPTIDDEEDEDLSRSTAAALPLSLVEKVIDEVLVRKNYGLEAPLGVRLPAAVSVWRWEVRSEHWDWLPKNSREKAESRQAERSQVSLLLGNTYDEP
jgi:chromatin assembly factor 1 subunit A